MWEEGRVQGQYALMSSLIYSFNTAEAVVRQTTQTTQYTIHLEAAKGVSVFIQLHNNN